MTAFAAILRRDLRIALRGGGAGTPLAFFVLVAALLPLGVGPGRASLAEVSAGAIWLAAFLATLLSLDRLFRADLEDGSLDQLRCAPIPLEMAALAKCAANWLTTGPPLAMAAPALAALHGAPMAEWPRMSAALLLGTPSLTLIGAVGAALTAGLRAPGLLLPVLVVPLATPALIFGSAAAAPGASNAMLLLGAFTLAALALAPFAAAAALRFGSD